MGMAWRAVNRLLDGIGSLLFIALSVVVMLQVVCRFVLRLPSPWSEELARYFLVILTMLGAALAARDRSHLVAIDLFRRAPRIVRQATGALVHAAILVFSALMLKGSLDIIHIAGEETATSFVWLKMAHVYTALPVSFALMCLYAIAHLGRALRAGPTGEGFEDGR